MIDRFTEVVVKDIRKELNDMCDFLANEGAKDYAHYKYVCGLIRGLGNAEQYLIDRAKQAMKGDEDE